MKINLIRSFIPGKDVNVSKQFYLDLGFKVIWEGEDLVEFGTEEQNFFLQKYYQEDWANNTMIQMFVEDLDSLYNIAENVIPNYKGTKIKSIFTAHYGRTFHLIDPSGVLWHMCERLEK